MATEYDTVHYASMKQIDPVVKYVQEYSLFHYIGDLTNKKVLDIGCGFGYYTRMFKLGGASVVVGVDISEDMIELASNEEDANPLGVKYKVVDARSCGKLGEFDLVSANVIMMYNKTMADLEVMISNISKNLRSGGRFVGVNFETGSNLWHDRLKKYGRSFRKIRDIAGGIAGEIAWCLPNVPKLTAMHYYYEPNVYKDLFEKNGFRSVRFEKMLLDNEGLEKYPIGYWDEFMKNPNLTVIVATKE